MVVVLFAGCGVGRWVDRWVGEDTESSSVREQTPVSANVSLWTVL